MTEPFNWKAMAPQDGYFAVLNVAGEVSAELSFGLFSQGQLLKSKSLAKREFPTARIVGDLKRQLIFWEGVAEFMNAGGHFHCILADLPTVLTEFTGQIEFNGWSYFDTGINPMTGNRVHEFISDAPEHESDMRFVRWVRGEFIDVNLRAKDMVEDENHESNDTPSETDYLCESSFESEGQTDQQADSIPGT